MTTLPAGWKPIETVPENEGRPMFCLLAFGPEGDQSVGKGFRFNGKWYVGATFYCLGKEKSYEIREIEVQPTHWMPIPNLPGEESDTPPASAQDAPITVSLDPDPRGVSVGVWQGSRCIYNGAHAVPVAQGDAKDAARYRWLRDPQSDVALVLDKRTGYVPVDESIPWIGGYHTYEYRAGEELDATIDEAIAASQQQEG